MFTQTNIYPGEGFGNSIRLGHSMYSIIHKLVKFNHKLSISYSDKNYLRTPILVTLPNLGIRLMFGNRNQSLMLIEIINFNYLKLIYNGISLNDISVTQGNNSRRLDTMASTFGNLNETVMSPATVTEYSLKGIFDERDIIRPTLKLIYNKIFGPTYPGKTSDSLDCYILSYPGISFRFSLNSDELKEKLRKLDCNENAILSKLLNWDKPDDIPCVSLSIFEGNSWDDFYSKFNELFNDDRQNKDERNINRLLINLKLGLVKVIFEDEEEFVLKIGETTQQEILNILGPPDDHFNKFDSRLLIHKHLSKSLDISEDTNNNSIYKFHNYFKFGLDILYDLNDKSSTGKTGILKKVVIHNGGVAESLDFMKWNKCNWEMITGKLSDNNDSFDNAEDIKINSCMYFSEIPTEFFNTINSSTFNSRPVLLKRNESEFIDNDLDIIDTNEVGSTTETLFKQKSNSENSLLSNSKIKTWGQSKLYGCHRCIWEVIDSIGCISSVTIY